MYIAYIYIYMCVCVCVLCRSSYQFIYLFCCQRYLEKRCSGGLRGEVTGVTSHPLEMIGWA